VPVWVVPMLTALGVAASVSYGFWMAEEQKKNGLTLSEAAPVSDHRHFPDSPGAGPAFVRRQSGRGSHFTDRFNFLADAAELASPVVVNILVDVRGPWGVTGLATGSGFIVDGAHGLVATNAHVVAPAAESNGRMVVTLTDGRKFGAKVKAIDRQLDIALVQLDLPAGSSAQASLAVARFWRTPQC